VEKNQEKEPETAMNRLISILFGTKKKSKAPRKSQRKTKVLDRLQVTCLRDTVTHEQKRGGFSE